MYTFSGGLGQHKRRNRQKYPTIKNHLEKVQYSTPQVDTNTNLHNFTSRICWVPTEIIENANMEAPEPTTRQIPRQEAMPTFLKIQSLMNINRNWTHMRFLGLRIKHFESQRCYQANGTTGDPQNSKIKFKIRPKSN